jgi:hypothetical protein
VRTRDVCETVLVKPKPLISVKSSLSHIRDEIYEHTHKFHPFLLTV